MSRTSRGEPSGLIHSIPPLREELRMLCSLTDWAPATSLVRAVGGSPDLVWRKTKPTPEHGRNKIRCPSADLLRGFGRLRSYLPEGIGGYPLVGYITFPRIEDKQIGLGTFQRCG